MSWLFSCRLINLPGEVFTADAEDKEGHNAFYYAVRSSNIELLRTLIDKWPTNHFTTQPDKLDSFLSAAYEELKLKNVALSNEMHLFIHTKLVNLRFNENKPGLISISDIEDRIDLLLENNATLQDDYGALAKVDEKFLFIATFIARNIRVLKGQLIFTYDQLPWEEMEFCLVIFLASQSGVQELNHFYRSTVSKTNILKYLDCFTTILGGLKGNISPRKTPRLIRDNVIASIIRTTPLFQGLYDNYQEVRDVYSLNVMSGCIGQALTADCATRRGQLVIKRTLQVIGEHLKNTLSSPNLSDPVSDMLILSAPKEMRKVLTDLRNSLSHIHSIDYHDDHKLYSNVQDDLKNIGAVITDIILFKKNLILKSTLETIIETKDWEEIHKIMQLLFQDSSISLERETLTVPATNDQKHVQQLLDEIDGMISEKTPYEKEIIDEIHKLICKPSESLKISHDNYLAGLDVLTLIYHSTEHILYRGQSPRNHDNIVRHIKQNAQIVLENLPQYSQFKSPEEPIILLIRLYNSLSGRISDQTADDIKLLINKISYTTLYSPGNIQWIDEFRDHLIKYKQKKSLHLTSDQIENQMKKDVDELKDILSCNKISNNSNATHVFNCNRLAIEVLLLDIMSILDNSNSLASNPLYLDDGVVLLTGKSLRNQLAHGNILVDMLFPENFYALLTNAKILTQLSPNSQISHSNRQTSIDSHSVIKLKQIYNHGIEVIHKMEEMCTALIDGNLENFKKSLMKGADLHSRSVNLRSTLHYAAQGPSLDAVKYLINKNVKVDSTDIYGQTPLHIAALFGRASIVEYLVKETNLPVSAIDNNCRTALHLAAQSGHKESVQILLSLGASNTACDRIGYSSLHYAVVNKCKSTVELLLQQDENVDANTTNQGFTALHLASEFGYADLVDYFLSKNADANKKSYIASRPLFLAVGNSHLDVVKILIKNGAHVNFNTCNGSTALLSAVSCNHEEIVNILLKSGAIVNVCDNKQNLTPLHLAACEGYRGIAKMLIEYGADVDVSDYQGATPLILAAINGHREVAQLLLEHGALVHKTSAHGITALHMGAMYSGSAIIQFLLEQGLEIEVRTEHHRTPLLLAAYEGNLAAVCTLLANGADVNSIDDNSNSPLLLSTSRRHIHISEALINNGANVNYTNSHCMSALHLSAKISDNEEIVKMLLERGIHVNTQDQDGNTALHLASTWGNHGSVYTLIITGKADLNVVTNEGDTPLHKATSSNHKTIVELLLANGAKVNMVNRDGYSPLSIAAKSNNQKLVEMLIDKGADVNSEGNRPLHSAVFAGNKRIVDTLLKHKDIDLSVEDNEELTLLHLAAFHGHWSIGRALINCGVLADAKNSKQITPLSIAVFKDKKEFVDMLLANGANVKDVNHLPKNASLLQVAIECGNPEIVRSLLNAGAVLDINAHENKSETLLELAVVLANLDVVKVLFNHYTTINVNYAGIDNCTTLHTAARVGTLDVLKYLIAKGADVNAKNTSGSKPIHIAAFSGHQKIVSFFLKHGMCIGDLGTAGRQVLHYAAEEGHEALVQYLVRRGADVNAVDDCSETPLHVSVRAGYIPIVKILLNYGSYHNAINTNGLKPVNYAKSKDMSDIFTLMENLFKAVKDNAVTKVEDLIKLELSVNAKCANNGSLLHFVAWKGYDELCEVLLKSKANPNALGKNRNTALHYAAKFSHWRIIQSLLTAGAIYNVKTGTGKTPLDLASHHKVKYLLMLVQDSFSKIENCDVHVMDDLIEDTNILKAVFQARNENQQSLIVVAINFHFPKVNELKELMVNGLSDNMCIVKRMINQQENFKGALKMLNQMFNDCRETIGEDNPITLELQEEIALVLFSQNKYSQAFFMLEEVYQKQCLVFGKYSETCLITKRYIAFVLAKQSKYEEAYHILQEVYEKQKKILTEDHLEILSTKRDIAKLLCNLKRFKEASIILKEVSETNEEFNQNPRTQEIMAAMLYYQGKPEEAICLFREINKVEMATLGQNHSKTLETRSNIASVLVIQNKYDEALKEYQEILAIQNKFLGPCHPNTLHTEGNIANLYTTNNRSINTILVLNSIGLDRRKEILGFNHRDVKLLEQIEQEINLLDVPTKTQPALISAASKGDKIEIERLIRDGCDLDMEDGAKRTALHFAASKGLIEIVKLLLRNGADATITTLKGNTTLHTATSRGHCRIVELLLQNVGEKEKTHFNEFVNAKTYVGESTALHVAAERGYKEILIVLLTYGACYDVVDETFEQMHLQSSHHQGNI